MKKNRTSVVSVLSKGLQASLESQALRSLLDQASREPEPDLALQIYRQALDFCAGPMASAEFRGTERNNRTTELCFESLMGVAESMWRLNRTDEASELFEEILRLDPSDRRFARFWLAACLFDVRRYAELGTLCDRFRDPTPPWLYVKALSKFASEGDAEPSRELLLAASRKGRRFLDYLFGEDQIDASRRIRLDSDSSMHSFARLFLRAWRSVPGALAWTRRVLKVPLSDRSVAPLPFPADELGKLKRTNTTWQVAVVEMDQEHAGDQPCWIVAIVDRDSQEMRHITVIEAMPSPVSLWPEVLKAMLQPTDGRPARPARIEVARPEFRRAWQVMLRQIDCDCQIAYRMHELQKMLKGMGEILSAQRLRPLADAFDPLSLPQSDSVWQIDFYHHPVAISNAKIGVERPWSVVALDKDTQLMLCAELLSDVPLPGMMWEYACRLMQRDSGRPRQIELADGGAFNLLKPKLAEANVACVLRDELPELHGQLLSLAVSYGDPGKCALRDGHGVDHEAMESFYESAAQYYKGSPWRHVPGDVPIEVRLPSGEIRYAVIMGRSGMTMGLSVYEDWDELGAVLRGRATIEEISVTSVIFDEATILAPVDLFLVERHGWPIATPEAYPSVLQMRPGHLPATPAKRELRDLEALLRCLPDFAASGDMSRVCKLQLSGIPSELRLQWTRDRSRWH